MNAEIVKQIAVQLEALLETYRGLKARSKYHDLSDQGETTAVNLVTRSAAAIERASGPGSVYTRQVREFIARKTHEFERLAWIIGVVESLYIDLTAGYIQSASELIHGEIFGDFMEMADHLLEEGYQDAAAVIIGSTLEAHLRQLCVKNAIPTDLTTARGVQPKKADSMNSDLGNATAISKLDQKNVTAWLDLRNKAAHGRYTEYTRDQVALLIAGVRDFITRNPA